MKSFVISIVVSLFLIGCVNEKTPNPVSEEKSVVSEKLAEVTIFEG